MPKDKPRRVIRVFVSSTFQDMQAEREELIKRIFPQLRTLCEQRAVTWAEIDLRWGITDEEQHEGKVLPICLAEIDHCRPWFLGILGERYGSLPRAVPEALLAQMPWLAQEQGKSVTELEILHGVLKNAEMKAQALFYFRDPAIIRSLSEEQSGRFVERDPASREKLRVLKDQIRASGCAVRENYRDARELGEWVLRDFSEVIERIFPKETAPSERERETAAQESYAESRSRVYIRRTADFARLDAHAAGAGEPLVLTGESGVGKSALLANWALEYRRAHPHEPVILHFIGADPASANWAAMLRRIMAELSSRFDLQLPIPDHAEELPAVFARAIYRAAARGRFVLVLDGLNQIEDRNGAPDLGWLPSRLPQNARLFLSALPGRSLDALRRRGWPEFNVEPLDRAEREQLITDFLRQYSKALDTPQAQRVAAAAPAANPLYLRLLLEELRLWGEHKTLDSQIDRYLAAPGPAELFDKVLARWQDDYERDRAGLVRDVFSLLWAGHYGLAEAELLDLLGAGGEPLPAAFWSPLWLAAEHSLVDRSGLLNFGHQYLRDAVRARFLPSEADERAAHLRLADYFEEQPLSRRKIDELPWQLSEAHAWPRLARLLAFDADAARRRDSQFLARAWDRNQFDVLAYWTKLEAAGFKMEQAYASEIESADLTDPDFLDVVALLLEKTGRLEPSIAVRRKLIRHYEQKPGSLAALEVCLGGLAASCLSRGNLPAAQQALERQEAICRQLGDDQGLQKCLGAQGLVQFEWGRLSEAMALHRQQEQLCLVRKDVHGLGISLHNQAMVAYTQRDYERALDLCRREESMARQIGDQDGLQKSYGGQANALAALGRLSDVMDFYGEQERICRILGDKLSLVESLGNQARYLRDLGNFPESLRKDQEAEALCRETGYAKGLAICIGSQASTLGEMGRSEEQLKKLQEQEEVCRKIGNRPVLRACLANQAVFYTQRNDYPTALRLWDEQEAILRELELPPELAQSLAVRAHILKNLGRSAAEIRPVLEEQEQILRRIGNPEWLLQAKINQALHLPEPERGRAVAEARNLGRQYGLSEIVEAMIQQCSL